MSKIFPRKTYYELQEKLGEGLTSEVYRAFRVDQTAWTKQVVALKIIKSKKNVQILKREFEKLSRVHSKYCVQMKSWENLPQGSALVLEYIEGLTLDDVDKSGLLTIELIDEVIIQIYWGLMALHRTQVYHGDLNLKNVIINTEGTVKLIDFGFFSSEKENWVTPYFASPCVLGGERPNVQSDLYSLEKIKNHLLKRLRLEEKENLRSGVEAEEWFKEKLTKEIKLNNSKASRRRTLALTVKKLRLRNSQGTQVLKSENQKKQLYSSKTLLLGATLFFVFALFFPLDFWRSSSFTTIELRSKEWTSLSMNGLPPLFSPIKPKKMRSGRYTVQWKTSKGSAREILNLPVNKTFMLNPKDKNL